MHFFRIIFFRALFFIFIFFFQNNIKAQIQSHEFQSWYDLSYHYKFNDKVSQVGDIGARYYYDTHWSVFYIRPGVSWKIKPTLNATGGVAAFYSINKITSNITDLRIFQSLELAWPKYKGFELHQRVMLEERWLLVNDSQADFIWRGRYRLSVNTPYYTLFGSQKSTYNQIAVEFLDRLDVNNFLPFNNRRRYTFVLGHELSEKLTFEINYQLQGLQVKFATGFKLEEQILRISLKLKLNA